ncbi:hypothetical protein QWT69_11465 [Sporosarcina oncorhynchi]|uniref:Uncharacterized protein n=1 Tax=Sporosarcina oncorhynchi TaxID=3056444 RepID=A0ABZ0L247_9BACL|nr:hypothetical protein [Sporosarcina sp. T2O-4]WOV86528.1 hypothetical protein QWT69_11465 [Sporosarcina sp. T2O-4]
MKKPVWEQYNSYTEMTDGKDVTPLEMQIIYNDLVSEYKSIADQIVESIDRNDYIELSKLINQRKHVQAAIDEMKALYGDKLHMSHKTRGQLADALSKSAYFADTRGEEALRSIFTGFEKINETVRTAADKAVNGTTNALNLGNRMNYKISRSILSQTTNSLLKLANTFKK